MERRCFIMQCKKCGKECLESELTNNLCENCIKNENIPSLKWFNFFYKIYLPIVIILNFIFAIPQVSQIVETETYNIFTVSYIILCIVLYIIIPFLAYSKVEKSKETGYILILLVLICDYVCKVLFTSVSTVVNYSGNIFTYIVLSTLIYAIWFVPNIIYFIKRRNYFFN